MTERRHLLSITGGRGGNNVNSGIFTVTAASVKYSYIAGRRRSRRNAVMLDRRLQTQQRLSEEVDEGQRTLTNCRLVD